jgi:MFS transporter, ACS family, hexuronate transporter
VLARVPLALGESGTFPAALSVASQWFPVRERAFAIGIFNAGANIGAIVTPLIVPILMLNWGWRSAFLVTGVVNFIWIFIWFRWYQKPALHPQLSLEERAHIESESAQGMAAAPVPPGSAKTTGVRYRFRDLLKVKQTWAYMCGRFLIDPVWWTFLFWLPDFFSKTYGFNLKEFGLPLVVIYLLADVGAVLGGFSSSHLLKQGVSLGRARKLTMFFAATLAVPVAFATHASSFWLVVLMIGAACAAHQGFSTNLFAIPGDLFPQEAQGKLVGLGGFAGALGGFLAAKSLGWLLDSVGSYTPFFIGCGAAYLLAWLVTHALNSQYTKPTWRVQTEGSH